MVKNTRVKGNKKRKTFVTKTKKGEFPCKIGYQTFEKDFKEYKEAKEAQKDIISKYKPLKVKDIRPTDNFYNYTNYSWLENIKTDNQQQYIVQVDDFRLTQDKVYRELHEILVEYMKKTHTPFANSMRNYYNSIIRMNTQADSRKRALKIVEDIDALRSDPANLYKMLALKASSEITSPRSPITFNVMPDEKNPKVFTVYLGSSSFYLLDINVYFDDATEEAYKASYRKEFFKNVNKTFDTVLGPGHGLSGEDVFFVEQQIINCFGGTTFTEPTDDYNKITIDEAATDLGLDWPAFAKELGFKKTPSYFCSVSKNYMKAVLDILKKDWNSDKWRSYWCYSVIQMIARITSKWETLVFDFFGKFQKGQEGINVSDAVSAALYMSLPYNTFLTNEYVARHGDPYKKEFVRAFLEDLKQVFVRIISNNKWMAPSTKKYALKKFDHMKFLIGAPEYLVPDPNIKYGNNTYENITALMTYRHNMFIHYVGKGVVDLPIMDWTEYPVKMIGSQAYIVNASYTPAKNAVYINWGYIQKPFVDLEERGIEYNLAHIGNTVAHELSHAMDDTGSKYDHEGVLRNWWTPHDRKIFEQKQKDVIKQYETFAARDGIVFDAAIGIGEDLADISAVAICDTFLRDFQQKNKDLIPIRNLSFDAYYTYFAFQQKQKIKKKAIRAQLKTNPHPLDVYRTNVPLSRSETFRTIYDVKKGDGMWWHTTDSIW
jgi:putative endopeptidase